MQVSSRFQLFHEEGSSSGSSGSSSSSEGADSPLAKFNRLLQSSLSRHWQYFTSSKSPRQIRGRSLSDSGLCTINDADSSIDYNGLPLGLPKNFRHSIQICNISTGLTDLSTGGSSSAAGGEEVSDGSGDADRTRRSGYHLRVPTPHSAQSTGNFASGAGCAGAVAGATGGVAPRSAPATPLQLEPQPKPKHDKHAVKSLSSSAPSVRASTASAGAVAVAAGAVSDASEGGGGGKAPNKSRQKKFLRHFPQVGPDERVLNYYSCALVGDILLQGHLYITKNYFAFYSNVFGYVTKLLIPTTSVLRVSKEKMARIIPNAVGVCTSDERHVFGSLLSRDSTYKLMTHVWKAAGALEPAAPPPPQELRISEAELDASEYSPEDESSSGGGDCAVQHPTKRKETESIIAAAAAGGAAVIQPALLTGAGVAGVATAVAAGATGGRGAGAGAGRALLLAATLVLALSATYMACRLYQINAHPQDELAKLSGAEVYSELMRWRTKLHGRAASELHAFLTTNMLLLSKVRQSLETLSSVILTDMNHSGQQKMNVDIPPTDTAFS